jgi:6-phosphogluconolactonase
MIKNGTVEVFDDLATLSQAAVVEFVELVHWAIGQRGIFQVCLSGGSTPQTLFRTLAQPPFSDMLPWDKMRFFWGDERLVPPDDPESNYGQVQRELFSRVRVPPENILRTRGELPPQQAASDINARLLGLAEPGLNWPRMDLVLLGLGADGHTASLFPESDPALGADQAALAVTGDYQGRPANRVTFTPALFNSAYHVLFLVAGADKADALAASVQGPDDPRRWPAQRILPTNGEITWLVDTPAASKLIH